MSADAEKEAVWNEVAAATAEVEAGKQVGFITPAMRCWFSTGFFTPANRLPGVAGDVPGVTSFAAIAACVKMRRLP